MSNHTYRALGWEGVSVDAWSTSAGRVLVSDWDETALQDWFATHAAKISPDGKPDRTDLSPLALESGQNVTTGELKSKIQTFQDLRTEIDLIRRQGYAVVDEEFELGVVGVSAPVYDFKQRIIAAFNVSAPKQRLGRHLEQAGMLAARVASEFSATLGASDGVEANRRLALRPEETKPPA